MPVNHNLTKDFLVTNSDKEIVIKKAKSPNIETYKEKSKSIIIGSRHRVTSLQNSIHLKSLSLYSPQNINF